MKLDTYLVQGPQGDSVGSLHAPIYLNASFQAQSAEHLAALFQRAAVGNMYARLQNPNCKFLEDRLAGLLNALGVVVTNTGMSAISGALFTLTQAGGRIVASPGLFSGTLNLLRKVLPRFGVQTDFCDLTDLDAVNEAIDDRTCLVFGEPLSNPALKLLDIPALAQLCQNRSVPLVLDATMTPPCMLDLSRWPVAVGVHSTTKYIMGNGSLLGGAVCDWGQFPWQLARDALLQKAATEWGQRAFLEHYRLTALHTMGLTQQPFAAAMHEIQLDTLVLRHQRQCRNAARLADFFNWQPGIKRVSYLGLETDPGHQLARKLFQPGYYGNLIALDLDTQERAFQFLNNLRLVKQMTNLGDLRSLIIHPASTMYYGCSEEERKLAGVTPGLVRLSVGTENIDDLLEDFTAAIVAKSSVVA